MSPEEGTLTMPAIEVQALTRSFDVAGKRVDALAGVDLSVPTGEVHGLLGPNGAGKTTLVKILATALLPTSGSARVLGLDVVSDVHEVRRHVGMVLGGERGLYTRVTARRNLHFWGALYGLGRRTTHARAEELLERVGLADRADRAVETFSRGMKQRLHLARGLLHDPAVIFLDEPTTGMDPVAALEFRTLVRALRNEGRTILITTHNMAEAESLCSRVTLVDKGSVLLTGDTQDVARTLGAGECVDFEPGATAVVDELRGLPFVDSVVPVEEGGATWRAFPVTAEETGTLLRWLVERDVLSARRSVPSLESVYLKIFAARGMAL